MTAATNGFNGERIVSPSGVVPLEPIALTTLDDLIGPAIDRAERRMNRIEKPIPLLWPALLPHFGGGLWPGVHYIVAGTGFGKSALAIQQALYASRLGFPAAYIGLELEGYQVALRVVAEQANVSWSRLYTGDTGQKFIDRARAVLPSLRGLPFHPQFGRPRGWPASELSRIGEAMRKKYPEPAGPGSRPLLIVLDFLQIVGPEDDGRSSDLRERISNAAYAARDLAARLDIIVLVISSVARDKYAVLASASAAAEFTHDTDDQGRPTNRRMMNPDAIIGLGKETGDIEFSGDTVSVLFRVPSSAEGGANMIFATPKARATVPMWTPMLFTGFGFKEPADGGASIPGSLATKSEKKSEKKQQEKDAKLAREQEIRAEKQRQKEQAQVERHRAEEQAVVTALRGAGFLSAADLKSRVAALCPGGCSKDNVMIAVARLGDAVAIENAEHNARRHRLVESRVPEWARLSSLQTDLADLPAKPEGGPL